MSNPSITADKTPWYQWDTGLTVTVSGGAMTECHFANRKQGTAYVQAVINGIARVPDELLQVAAPIKAYGYVSDGAGGQTYVEQTFEVIARNIPSDYTYTKTAQKTIRDAEAARDEAVQAAKDAKASELVADDSAVEASNYAQSAGESASAAATSARTAAKSAGDAANSASDAKAAAGKAVEDASALLKTYTDNAKTSAYNAATSASNAADAASAASGSASAAEQSATDANSAKVAAQTAKDEAETAKSEAATSASNAESSATAAAKSASDAAASVGAINVIAPKTVIVAPTAEGYKSVAIGDEVIASGKGSVALGYKASSVGFESIAIGDSANAQESFAVALGELSDAREGGSVAVGYNSVAYTTNEFSVGNNNYTREITHVSEPTAPTSASTKKYTDANDAKTLSEANKYTDENTSNALVGTVSGKMLHVEDAWPSKPLGLTIDGAYKQDGTPSPENPVPIEVIENPVLHVTGKNLFDYKNEEYWGENVNGLDGDELTLTQSIVSVLNAPLVSGSNFTIGADVRSYVSVSGSLSLSAMPGKGISYDAKNAYFINVGVSDKYKYTHGSFMSKDEWASINTTCPFIKNVQVEYGTKATEYTPYAGATIPITLPAEHPYLAKLPDGTHDEIEIDKDGNASLVARVGKYQASGDESLFYIPSNTEFYIIHTPIISGAGLSPEFPYVSSTRNTFGFSTSDNGDIYMSIPGVATDYDSAVAWVKANKPTFYGHSAVKTYSLGKLDIPALPETISNVWVDAELTTNMSMTYKRDINVAYDNLVQAVVAAAAGE